MKHSLAKRLLDCKDDKVEEILKKEISERAWDRVFLNPGKNIKIMENSNRTLNIAVETLESDLKSILRKQAPRKATHVRILPSGKKRAKIVPVKELLDWHGVNARIEFGIKPEGGKFEGMGLQDPRKKLGLDPAKVKIRGSGFIAEIDELLATEEYTARAAAEQVFSNWPDKKFESVHKIVKTRPYHLRRQGKKPKSWKKAEVNQGSGFMAEIDKLLIGGKHTTREVAEIVYEQFEKDSFKSVLRIVRTRPWHLRKRGIEVHPKSAKVEVGDVTSQKI